MEPEGDVPDTEWLEQLLAATEQSLTDVVRATSSPAREQLIADLGMLKTQLVHVLTHLRET